MMTKEHYERDWDPAGKFSSKHHGQSVCVDSLRSAARKVDSPRETGSGLEHFIDHIKANGTAPA